ncbi:MAG: nuclear transport factor 2 family protein [Saprospirales bacterium]|nr:MAG: nuclear transport factor 2 family protein [Saprospirales bacterium]
MTNKLLLLIFSCLVYSVMINAQDEVLDLHRKKFEWMIQLQLDSLESILADDMLYIHSNGWIEDREEVIENLRSGHLAYHKIDIRNQEVRYFDRIAIVVGEAEFHVSLDGSPLSIDLLYTEVYRQDGDRWFFIHRHSNRNTVSN